MLLAQRTGNWTTGNQIFTLPPGWLPALTWASIGTTTLAANPQTATLRFDGVTGIVIAIGLSGTASSIFYDGHYPLATP